MPELKLFYLLLILCHFGRFLFLGLEPLHYLFCLFVFVHHDVTDAKVGNNNGSQAKHVIIVFLDYWFVVADGFVIAFEDKKYVGNIKLPDIMVGTKFRTLSKELLHNGVIFFIPVDLCLRHKHWNVLIKTIIKLFERFLNTFIVLSQSSILDAFGELPESIDVPICNYIEFSE